jgi:hypothetical protein
MAEVGEMEGGEGAKAFFRKALASVGSILPLVLILLLRPAVASRMTTRRLLMVNRAGRKQASGKQQGGQFDQLHDDSSAD